MPRSVVYKKKPKKKKLTLPELIEQSTKTQQALRKLDAQIAERAKRERQQQDTLGPRLELGPLTLGVRKDFLGKTKQALGEIGTAAIYTPAGIYEAGKAVGLDTRDVVTGRDFTPSRSRDLGEVIARSTYEDLRHPLRHPGYTALTAFAALSAGSGAAARGAAAARGQNSLRRPRPGRIEIAEGAQIPLSPNALVRAGQRRGAKRATAGKGISSAAELGPVPGIPGRSLPRRVGLERAARERVLRDIERAPAEGLQKRARKLDDVEQTAVRVVAEGQPVAARIAAHQRDLTQIQGTKPTATLARRRLKDKIRILHHVEKRKLVDEVDGVPTIRPGSSVDKVYGLSKASAERRQEIFSELGLLDEGRAQARISAPGRVIEGDASRINLREGEHYYDQDGRLVPTDLYKKAGITQYDTTKRLNLYDDKGEILGSIAFDDRPDRPFVNVESIYVVPGQRGSLEALTELTRPVFSDGRPVIAEFENTRLGPLLNKMEERYRSGKRERPAATAPSRPFSGGDFFISNAPRRGIKTGAARIGNAAGIGIPRKPSSITQSFTGESIKTGRFQNKAVRQIAESELEAQRYQASLRGRDIALGDSISAEDYAKLSAPEQRHYRPVRVDKQPYSPETRDFLAAMQGRLEDNAPISALERETLRDQVQHAHRSIFPKLDEVGAEAASGQVRFYDRRRLGGLDELTTPITAGGRITATAADELNAAMQLAILFLKPAYLTPNLLGQAALTLIEQGAVAPWNAAKAAHLYRSLSAEDRAAVRGASGLGLAQSLPAERGKVFKPARDKAARAYGKVLDSPFRWASFVHNARLLGYNTVPKIKNLLSEKANLDDLVEISRRTRDNMIDYERMGPSEQKIIRRAIFFYPWVKGSSLYAGRFVRDHPLQADVTAQLALVGEEQAQEDLGDVPGFAKGIFKVGEDAQGRPLVADPRAAGLFGSPVDLKEAGTSIIRGLTGDKRETTYELEDLLSPAASLPFQAVNPHDPLYGYELPLGEALKREYLTGLPQYRLASGVQAKPEEQADRLYPTDPETAVGRFAVGGVYPHPVNLDELESQAVAEDRSALTPIQRIRQDIFAERQTVLEAAKKYRPEKLEDGRLPQWLRAMYNNKAEREGAWAQVKAKSGTAEYHRSKLEAEVRLLSRWGIMPAKAAREWRKWAKTADLDKLKAGRDKLSNQGFEKAYLKGIREVKADLEDLGASFD